MTIPRAFFMGASNSVIAYDKALEDRLLHLPVTDPRKSVAERKRLGGLIVNALGLLPDMADSHEMQRLIEDEVCPMYEIMDHLKKRNAPPSYEGSSVRNLIGQAQLREVQSNRLRELIDYNNMRAAQLGKLQFLFLLDGKHPPAGYEAKARKFLDLPTLTAIQRQNVRLNLELIEFENTRLTLNQPAGRTTHHPSAPPPFN